MMTFKYSLQSFHLSISSECFIFYMSLITSNPAIVSVVTYSEHQNSDCVMDNLSTKEVGNYLPGNDPQKKEWCNYSPNCGGYTVSHGHVQLKDKHCKNNLSYSEGTTTYIKVYVEN